ncbi:MAG: endonuclease III [Bacteroidota bacterium]|nr:endonuclease III [Bacteroidota bacterium]
MNKKEQLLKIIEVFEATKPKPETELSYENSYQLLVAVILSAQCTDKRVNIITKDFFKTFPSYEKLSLAKHEDVFDKIKSCSYPNNKAKNLIGMAKVLKNEFNGIVPSDIDQLQKMPGVGRKTANVVASVAFGKATMPVDTHVFRVAQRIGIVKTSKTPREVEDQLLKIIPKEKIHDLHHWLILHGRYVCKARKPLCEECKISTFCNYKKSL